MGLGLTIQVKGQREFNRVLDEYKLWNKRQPAEIVNAKLYFVALNATNTTKTANKEEIASELNSPSRTNSEVPLAAILVNKQLAAKGKKGLTGEKMKQAVVKYIKKATSRIQFLRSPYFTIAKKLDYWNRIGDISFIKRFAPKKPNGIKVYGKEKGLVIAAKPNQVKTWGRITNPLGQGKQNSPTINPILQQGLSKAVAQEIKSMRDYIQRKYNEKINKVNKTKTF